MSTIIDTPEGIAFFRLAQMRGAVSLECKGLRHSRGSVYALAKRTYGLKGNKEKVLAQLEAMVAECLRAKEAGEPAPSFLR